MKKKINKFYERKIKNILEILVIQNLKLKYELNLYIHIHLNIT